MSTRNLSSELAIFLTQLPNEPGVYRMQKRRRCRRCMWAKPPILKNASTVILINKTAGPKTRSSSQSDYIHSDFGNTK